jgi:hypothetical protein
MGGFNDYIKMAGLAPQAAPRHIWLDCLGCPLLQHGTGQTAEVASPSEHTIKRCNQNVSKSVILLTPKCFHASIRVIIKNVHIFCRFKSTTRWIDANVRHSQAVRTYADITDE